MIPAPVVRAVAIPLEAAVRLAALVVAAIALVALAVVHVLTALAAMVDPDLRPRKSRFRRR